MTRSAVYVLRRKGGWIRRKNGTRIIYVGKSKQGKPPIPPWTRIQQHATGKYVEPGRRRYRTKNSSSKWWLKYWSLPDSTYHWYWTEGLSLFVEKWLIRFTIPMGNIQHNWSHPIRDTVRTIQSKLFPKSYVRKFSTKPGEVHEL